MKLTRLEMRRLVLPTAAAVVMLVAGGVLISIAADGYRGAQRALAAAQQERSRNSERLARISEEEREIKEKLNIYRQLQQLHILGEERRLEWADAIARIRADRELLDLHYRVDRQNLLVSAPGKPANVDFFASRMTVDLALLHEEDLMRFLHDLRASGNAYYSVQKCVIKRTDQVPSGGTIVPRLLAQCEVDLITAVDRAAKG